MRSTLTSALFLLLAAGVARAQGMEIRSGQTVRGEILGPSDVHLYRFEAAQDDQLLIQLKSGKYGPLDGTLRVFASLRELYVSPPYYGTITGNIAALPGTGTYFATVAGEKGTRGPYELRLRVRPHAWPSLLVSLPGELGIGAAAGSELSARIGIAPGGTVPPRLVSLTDPAGNDLLDQVIPKVGPKGATLTGAPVGVSGRHSFALDAADGAEGLATLRVKVRLPSPSVKLLTHDALAETSVAKVRRAGDVLEAQVDGPDVLDALLVRPDGASEALAGSGGHLFLSTPDDEDHPDGVYVLRVFRYGGYEDQYAMPVYETYPEPATITKTEPGVAWKLPVGGEELQLVLLRVTDRVSDVVFYEAALPGIATNAEIPSQVRPIGWPYRVEVKIQTPGRKAAISAVDVAGQAKDYNVTHPSRDSHVLVADTRDPQALAYETKYFQGLTRYTSSTGSLTRIADRGRFSFLAADDGGHPQVEPFPVLFLPGRFVVGKSFEGHLFAGPPRIEVSYIASELAGVWNVVGVTSGVARWGTIELTEDYDFRLWWNAEGIDEPDIEGYFNDPGGGVTRVYQGTQEFCRMTFLPDDSGGGLVAVDMPDGGTLLGAKRKVVRVGSGDGAYDAVSSAEDGVAIWRLLGDGLEGPGGERLALEFGDLADGLFSFGGETDGGVGLVAPEGVLFFARRTPAGPVLTAAVRE